MGDPLGGDYDEGGTHSLLSLVMSLLAPLSPFMVGIWSIFCRPESPEAPVGLLGERRDEGGMPSLPSPS